MQEFNGMTGEIWVLAGQSNMEGVGDLIDVETPDGRVFSFQSREEWAVAEEPLHWLGESPHSVHRQIWGIELLPEGEPLPEREARDKGAGLGLSFGKARAVQTSAPVGLIPAAHGGTSMEQWSPSKKSEGGASLYGATLKRIKAVGGKVTGVLWYQGESDSYAEAADVYEQRMTELVNAFRQDLGQLDLPFYIVQLGVFVNEPSPEGNIGWNRIRESQRVWPKTQKNVAVVSAIDLELDDAIHIGTQGLKRLGRRLAAVADGQTAPDLAEVSRDGNRLRVQFSGVTGGLQSPGRPSGFSLRRADGSELPAIYKVTLDGDAALLHLTDPALLDGAHLWYGYGFHPYCNLTDAVDMSVPAFGPVTV